MDYKTMTIDDIIEWCKENNEVKWLKEEAAKKIEYKVYPKVNGKADKTQEPTITERPISFMQIKIDFVDKFMPELAPRKEKKPSMYERIAAL